MKIKQRFILLILTGFIFNLIWESLHYPLYYDLSGIPHILHIITASVSDMIILTCIFLIISLTNKSFNWINKPKYLDYVLTIVLGLIIAVILEIINLYFVRWIYKPIMPTISGIGLSPLLQLATTGVVSLFVVKASFKQTA